MPKTISKSQRTKMVMSIDDLYGRVNELFELYDEGEMNEIKAHNFLENVALIFYVKVMKY